MSSLRAILTLIGARARRRPGRAAFTAIGLAISTAFAGAIVAEGTIAGDRAASSVLHGLSPLDRTVQVTYSDIVTPAVARQARAILDGLGAQTEVTLLNPVRLDGLVVRLAAIDPLGAWTSSRVPPPPCRARSCPMLLAGGRIPGAALAAAGVRIRIAGRTTLRSAVPLGFSPAEPANQPPLLLSGDINGLEAVAGLSGVYRQHSWLAVLPATLHSWQLAALEQRLRSEQAALLASNSAFSLTAPFTALDAARADAAAAPDRLRLAGGGALAAVALFIVLAVGGLRRDVDAELGRLRTAGATSRQCVLFVAVEAMLLCGVSIALGSALAVAAAAVEAGGSGVPVGGALSHSLFTTVAVLALLGAWLAASAMIAALLLVRGSRIGDLLSVAAVAAIAIALSRGSGGSGDPLPVLLAPLACLAAGVLVYRAAALLMQGAERLARRGPVIGRLALVGLARAPATPSLAIAFIAVSIGLGGFALAYRATLERSSADQAANRVPLDAIVSPGSDFITPLELAPLARWRAIARGPVAPVRRTEASYVSGGSSVTVPALGVPASTLPEMHGWRSADGSAPLGVLADRVIPSGPVRTPGPELSAGARTISLRAQARGIGVSVTADLRDGDGNLQRVSLGQASQAGSVLKASLPRGGPWELEGIELGEPTGLAVTSGHQNGENVAAATRFTARVRLGPLIVDRRTLNVSHWRAVGAAGGTRPDGTGVSLGFSSGSELGVLRPLQPSDLRPLPVLVDPETAAVAGRGRRLALTIDGIAIEARVVGVLARFPTVPPDASGFVVADQESLAAALDAQQPGQGRADELWISTARPGALRTALGAGALAQLNASFRADIQHQLRSAPIASAVLGTLIAATAICGLLAVIGLIVALLGAAHDARIERDLIAQGVGPRTLRTELCLRLALAGLLGVTVGLAIGVLLTRLAVASVRAAGTVSVPQPPVVAVAPWGELLLWALVAAAALVLVAWVTARRTIGRTA